MKLTVKLVKQGSGYYFRVPTALVNTDVLKLNEDYEIIDPKLIIK